MTTLDNIRNRLIDRILVTKNEKFLEVIENLFIATQEEDVLNLTPEQIEMLQMSEEDIKYGRVISDSEVDNLDNEWLPYSFTAK